MKIQGINTDVQAIATGMYNMFDTDEQACVAFGILPAVKMDCTERLLNEKIETMAKDNCEQMFGFRPENDVAKKDLKKNFVREAMFEISVAIYKHANSIGKMIV